MAITVKIIKHSADGRPTLHATRDLDVLPASIGRDPGCTIVLEDAHKHISRFHVEIEEEDGAYWVSVVSKVNPVMAKGRRYGPAARLALQSGDSFEIAEYEVQVLLPQPAPAAVSRPEVAQVPAQQADDAARLFNESTFFGADLAPDRKPVAHEPQPAEETFVPHKPAVIPTPVPSRTLSAFFEGAGLPQKEVSAMQAEQMLRDSGAMLRSAIEGVMRLLLARAEMRKEFAAGGTLAVPRDNNPLKLMSDPHQAMDFLFDPGERTDGLLDPVQAVGDACEELRSHELALVAGMRAAILGALRHFDPLTLERALDKTSFSFASRKARLWDLFVAQHDKLAREAQEDFNKAFGRDFVTAYHAHLGRLKGGR
jgi:predicted component of type VI protein secretion system